MIDFSISIYDLEYFLLIMTRVSCFIFIAPFFSMSGVPARVRIGLSVITSILLYQVLSPGSMFVVDNVFEYAILVIKEAATGLIIGFGANICMTIVNLAGSLADMETGLSMVSILDPATKEYVSITGVLYQYVFMLLLIASGLYRYLLGAIADTFVLIPVGRTVINTEGLLSNVVTFLCDYVMIGFRIVLPIFCVILLMNAILGIMAKVSPQMNMFAVGIQLKIIAGLSVLFLTVGVLPGAADFVFREMQEMVMAFAKNLM